MVIARVCYNILYAFALLSLLMAFLQGGIGLRMITPGVRRIVTIIFWVMAVLQFFGILTDIIQYLDTTVIPTAGQHDRLEASRRDRLRPPHARRRELARIPRQPDGRGPREHVREHQGRPQACSHRNLHGPRRDHRARHRRHRPHDPLGLRWCGRCRSRLRSAEDRLELHLGLHHPGSTSRSRSATWSRSAASRGA